jgi:hypothetical protein
LDAAASGLGVVIVTRQRKSAGQHGEAVRGSNALTGAVDIVIEIERIHGDADPAARVLRSESRYSGTPPELVARLTDDGYEACGSVDDIRANARKGAIRALLAGRDGLTAKEIAVALDETQSSVRRDLEAMQLHRTGEGKRNDPHRHFVSTTPDSLDGGNQDDEFATAEEEAKAARLLDTYDEEPL